MSSLKTVVSIVIALLFIDTSKSQMMCNVCNDLAGCVFRVNCSGPVECINRDDGNEEKNACNGLFCHEDDKRCNDESGCYSEWNTCNGIQECSDGEDEDPAFCKAYECPKEMTKCSDGNQCVYLSQYCDGKDDCNDKSDEVAENCKGMSCGWINEWRCENGIGCLYKDYLCDGDVQCDDGSDEGELCRNRQCATGFEKCLDGLQCVSVYTICSNSTGHSGCADGSDDNKNLCRDRECPRGFSKCSNNIECVRSSRWCDGTNDCTDDSDEDPNFCTTDRVCPELMEKCGNGKQCVDLGTRYVCGGDFIYSECRPITDEDSKGCTFTYPMPVYP